MRIFLVDDHTLFRDALVQYLERAEPGIDLSVAEDFYQAEAILKNDSMFDLVLLDFRMPGMNGHEGLEKLKSNYPDLKVALMSGVAEPEDVTKAMDLGAVGYFPKTLSGKALLQAIQMVLCGQLFMPLDSKNRMMPSYYESALPKTAQQNQNITANQSETENKPQKTIETIQLTPREYDVLALLLKGDSNKEIARELKLQVVTVKLHVRGICRKLDVKNRTQAALIARELGLLSRK